MVLVTKKPQKIILLKNNKMVFLYPFFPAYNNHYILQVAKKTRKKKRGNGSLFLCFIYRQAVYIENEKMLKKLWRNPFKEVLFIIIISK